MDHPPKTFEHCKAVVLYGYTRNQHCRSPATRDGYCGTHHPEAVARREARYAALRAQKEQSMTLHARETAEQRHRAECFEDLLAALREAREVIADSNDEYAKHVLQLVDRALSKAELGSTK